MKGFFKFIGILAAVCASIVGVMAIIEKFLFNKARFKETYLDLDSGNEGE